MKVVVVAVLAFVGKERVKRWAIAAAEFVFSWRYEGERVTGTTTEGGVMVMVHEVKYGFLCQFVTSFQQQMKIHHYSAL